MTQATARPVTTIHRPVASRINAFRRGFFGSSITVVAALVVLLTLVAALLPQLFTDWPATQADPVDRLLAAGEEGHLLGTDQLGRDVLARLVGGARLAWVVGAVVSAGSVLVGTILGAVAGYVGGGIDNLVSRAVDGILAFPPILLALVLAAVLGPSTRTAIIALGIVYTPLVARVMRAAVIGEREEAYVSASRGLGNSETRTLLKHLLRNTLGPMLVVSTIVVSRSIVIESSLSFLGAGTQPPTPSWGLMITEARELITTEPQLVLLPALCLSLTVLSINLLADAMSDYLEPGQGPVETRGAG